MNIQNKVHTGRLCWKIFHIYSEVGKVQYLNYNFNILTYSQIPLSGIQTGRFLG